MSATCAPFFIALISSVWAAAAAEVIFPDSETAEETVERGVEAESGAWVASLRLRAIAGSPLYRDTKLYQRLELKDSPNLTFFGFLEKDAGEAAVADYRSFYGRWTPTPGREVVLGICDLGLLADSSSVAPRAAMDPLCRRLAKTVATSVTARVPRTPLSAAQPFASRDREKTSSSS